MPVYSLGGLFLFLMASDTTNRSLTVQDYELVPVVMLKPHPKNPRKGDVSQIVESIKVNGFYGAVIAQKSTGHVLAGNHRIQAAKQLGIADVPVIWVDCSDQEAEKILLVDNRTNDLAEYNNAALAEILAGLSNKGELAGTGYGESDLEALLAEMAGECESLDGASKGDAGKLADRFGVPPFTVLNAREGWWQERKRSWLALGIESELGRGGSGATPSHPPAVTKNADGSLNYGGTKGQSKRFNKQRQPNAIPGGAPMPLDRGYGQKR